MDACSAALDEAHRRALDRLDSLAHRPVLPQATVEEVAASLGTELPHEGSDPAEVVEHLAQACEPGLTATPSEVLRPL